MQYLDFREEVMENERSIIQGEAHTHLLGE